MTVSLTPSLDETEKDRLHQIEELNLDKGTDWREEFKPGSLGCHELLDRASIVLNLVDQQLLSHPACVASPEWFALARQAFDALFELHQSVGNLHLSEGRSELTAEANGH